MKNNNSMPFAFRFLLIFGLVAILSSSAAGPQITPAFAQEGDNNGMQPLDVNGSSLYYYLDGQRVNLTPSLDWVSVKFVSDDEAEQEAATGKFGSTVSSLDGARSVPHLGLTLLPVNNGLNSKSFVQGVNSMRSDPGSFSQVNPVYSYDNIDMVVSDEFVAAFPETTGMAEIEAFNSARGVELISPITGQANTFVLRITSESSLDALGMANQYQESGFVLFAAPNFVRLVTEDETTSQKPSQPGPMFTPDDTYYTPDQWHLNNTGQFGGTTDADIDAPEAWDVTLGNASVTIAVLDEGVDLTHADLAGNMLAGYDATGLGSAGAPSGDDAHGTAVAGLAAAVSNNTLGVAGVCPLCTILPVRIAYGNGSGGWVYTDAWAADAIGWAYTNGADILNNSWGGGSGATVVNTAITNAVTNGRGGLGSVVVFAAGNDNASTVSWPASQSDVVAVGASNQCDQRKTPTNNTCNGFEDWWGSNYGSALDVVAPGVWLTTTDITGAAGYNDGSGYYDADYDGFMNGTSGAAPIVSGVLGLMMTVNPYMPADGLQDILEQTADDINTAGWDNETGHGRVNAYQSVLSAEKPDLIVTGYELRDGPYPTGALILNPNPDETFWIWISAKNRGGSASGNFYPGVFLDDKPNYGSDHDDSGPPLLTLGEMTDYQGYRITPSGAVDGAGCMYYDPTDAINPLTTPVVMERGNYTRQDILPSLPAGETTTVSVEISYPIDHYPAVIYDDDDVRTGLKAGSYSIYLYADANCAGGDEESNEANNALGPINFSVGGSLPSGPTTIDITIGGTSQGTYDMDPAESQVAKYSIDGGPVVISSNNGVGIIASLNQWRRRPSTTVGWTGVTQSMALPVSLITNAYYFPRYDYSSTNALYNNLLIANVDTVSRDITITIGGVVRGTYTLAPSQSQYVNYPGLVGGPVVV
ncbi:MAG: S8 family serine peptidase, partial [Chloroflexi bacterium]|nr:S8 family serine peptidase [Chloroflexota bacterium]